MSCIYKYNIKDKQTGKSKTVCSYFITFTKCNNCYKYFKINNSYKKMKRKLYNEVMNN